MIAFDQVTARQGRVALVDVSRVWGPGVHCIVGGPTDGSSLLLALLAGDARAKRGTVRVLSASPTHSMVRRQIAYVPMQSRLPAALRVDEVLRVACTFRAEAPIAPQERLAAFGIEALARRPVGSLSVPEARAVALCEGLTSKRVRIVLVSEPLVGVDPRAGGRIASALRAKGHDGSAVIATTASLADAQRVGDDCARLRRGVFVDPGVGASLGAGGGPEGAPLLVVTKDVAGARALLRVLAEDPRFEALGHDGRVIRLGGVNAVALAQAAQRAAVEADVDLVELRFEPTTPEPWQTP